MEHSARKMESTIACSQAINIFASNSSQLFASKGKVYAFAFYMPINAYLNLFFLFFFFVFPSVFRYSGSRHKGMATLYFLAFSSMFSSNISSQKTRNTSSSKYSIEPSLYIIQLPSDAFDYLFVRINR